MYVDMHSHILPGADHGSDSVKTSLSMLNKAVEAGVDTILSTSHFYMHCDTVDEFLKRREESYNELVSAMSAELKSKLNIVLGAEVTLEVDLDRMEGLEKLCIGNTRNILIEMPLERWTGWVYTALRNIVNERKLNPIIAHVDRYIGLNPIEGLANLDLPLQVNARSLAMLMGSGKLVRLFDNGYALYLGSDIHMDHLSYDFYSKAVKKLGSRMEKITHASRIAVGQIEDDSIRYHSVKKMI